MHALNLEISPKDGILGGVVDKLELKNMIGELDLCDVLSVFICPISLEPNARPHNSLHWLGL